jgi:hypothetical protein
LVLPGKAEITSVSPSLLRPGGIDDLSLTNGHATCSVTDVAAEVANGFATILAGVRDPKMKSDWSGRR